LTINRLLSFVRLALKLYQIINTHFNFLILLQLKNFFLTLSIQTDKITLELKHIQKKWGGDVEQAQGI
jgi:hypothetical protein